MLAASALLTVLATALYDAAVQLRDDSVTTSATITAIDTSGRDAGIVVRFTTRTGELVESEFGLPDREVAVGEELPVVYARDDPTLTTLAEDGPDFVTPTILLVLAVLSAALAAVSFAGWINWRLVLGLSPYDADAR